MRYVLGIELGGTRSKAAVLRYDGESWGDPQAVPLDGTPWVESVLHVSREGTVLAGRAALQWAGAEPERVARGFLRRVGDETPFVLGTHCYPAEVLTAVLVGWIADRVAEAERDEATRVAVTHPAGWGAHRRGLLGEALHEAGLPGVLLLPSPVAVAENHLARHGAEPGDALVVCRFGGEQVEATVLRRTPTGFEPLAHGEQVGPGAGTELDDLLTAHVLARLAREEPPPDAAMAGLRAACTGAKEQLSVGTEADLPTAGVRVTRPEFDALARPALTEAVALARRTAGAVPAGELSAVLLAGGTARVPLVTELVESAFGRAPAAEADPASAAARGAALATLAALSRTAGPVHPTDQVALVPAGDPEPELEPPPPRPPVEITPLEPPRPRLPTRRRNRAAAKAEPAEQKDGS
ncbi:Hsp70 family protein [Amycolatopsis cihanbeyliensis]|uniref:Hsp70 protein n=1 Tax=Amycolatopsis cihanbeyliensis TaxID=1128664 RepID=A0A542DMK3_AMYCI|nr:Hsp70 family protein [Amycolatopsis cihanbeyliensis]TQJ04331.1 Hsp70 protein [Amycolatopsis cihanbeyliensis]